MKWFIASDIHGSAYYCEKLIEAYKMDEDIHRITASEVFHTPFEEVTDLQRRNAKAVNFGIVYGISSFGLSQDLSISRKEAGEYIEKYFSNRVKRAIMMTIPFLAKGNHYEKNFSQSHYAV